MLMLLVNTLAVKGGWSSWLEDDHSKIKHQSPDFVGSVGGQTNGALAGGFSITRTVSRVDEASAQCVLGTAQPGSLLLPSSEMEFWEKTQLDIEHRYMFCF